KTISVISSGGILSVPKDFSLDQDLSTETALWPLRPALWNTTDPPTGMRTMLGVKVLSAMATSTVPEGCASWWLQAASNSATTQSAAERSFADMTDLPR